MCEGLMVSNNTEINKSRLDRYKTKSIKRRNRMIILTSCIIITILIFNLNAGKLLVIDDEEPQKSDAIIILSGSEGRLEKGVELYQEGYGDYFILTNSNEFTENEINLMRSNIPKEKIIYEDKADSTYTNATLTLNIMTERNFKSAIVITNDFHTSRSKYIFNKIYKDKEINLTYIASEKYNAAYWWKSKESRQFVLSEYIKWIGYVILY